MSRRRRAMLLLGLSLALGGLAAAEVSRRESALADRLGPSVGVVVARGGIAAGEVLSARVLVVRRIPGRYVPGGAIGSIAELIGLRAAVPIAAGAVITVGQIGDGTEEQAPGAPVRPGERVAEVVASGSADLVQAGARVDVLVTREGEGDRAGSTVLALEDVEVLAAAPGPGVDGSLPEADAGADAAAADAQTAAAAAPAATATVRVSLRVTLRQAVYLAAAQSFAREIRLLPRAPGDRRHGAAGLEVAGGLG